MRGVVVPDGPLRTIPLAALRESPKTARNKCKFILATDGLLLEAEELATAAQGHLQRAQEALRDHPDIDDLGTRVRATTPAKNTGGTDLPWVRVRMLDFDVAVEDGVFERIDAVSADGYHRSAVSAPPVGGATVLARVSGSSDLYRQKAYNDFALDLAVGPELQLGPGRLVAEAGVTQRWFGHKPFVRSARLGATYSLPLGSRTRARISGSASAIDNRRNALQDGKAYSGKVEVERALSATTGIAGYLGYDRQALKDPGYSTRGYRAGLLGWRGIKQVTSTKFTPEETIASVKEDIEWAKTQRS